MAKDCYEILGIPKSASAAEIKRAYKHLAKKHHPDVDKSAGANEKFKEINEAYQVLSNSQKKAAYDRFGHAGVSGQGSGFGGHAQSGQWGPFTYTYTSSGGQPSDFGGSVDPFDIFEEVFGFRGFRQPRKGQDLRYTITIDFMDTITGLTQEVNLNGKRIKIKIPQGIRDGGQLKFVGEGEAGPQGLPPGDLYLNVRIRPHPAFTRFGDDIYVLKEISFTTAALGGTIEVETVDKSVKLKIPAGTQPGTDFRLKSKGVPHLRGRGRGDQYVRVHVRVPEKLSREEKRLLKQLKDSASMI